MSSSRREPSAAGEGGLAALPAAVPAPADDREGDAARGERDADRGDDVDEHVAEVVVLLVAGQGEHALAELGHERLLHLVLRLALGDELLDVVALLLRLRRLGWRGRAGCRRPGT